MTVRINTVDAVFVHGLKELYSAESQLIVALTRMAVAADAPELRAGLARHLEQTRQHLRRVEQCLVEMGERPGERLCKRMGRLVADAERLIADLAYGPRLDHALIDAARKVEKYEIDTYRSTIAQAYQLGYNEIASLLEWNLQEEELTDYRLKQLAGGLLSYTDFGPGYRFTATD